MQRAFYLFVVLFTGTLVSAQQYNEAIKNGNKAYRDSNYVEAEAYYKSAIEKKNQSFESQYNLGNTLYQQEDWEGAANAFKLSETLTTDKDQKAQALHNLGNAYIQQQNFQDAADAFKNSLKLNPNDPETRYNLAQALRYLRKPPPEEKKDNNEEKKEENEDKNDQKDDNGEGDSKDQEKEEDGEKNENEKDNEQNETKKDEEQGDKGNEGEGQQPKNISQQEADRLLDALDREEQKLQEKLRLNEQKTRGKKTEKKW